MSRILFAAKHSWKTILRMSRPLFVGSSLQVTWWALGQLKGRKVASNDYNIFLSKHFLLFHVNGSKVSLYFQCKISFTPGPAESIDVGGLTLWSNFSTPARLTCDRAFFFFREKRLSPQTRSARLPPASPLPPPLYTTKNPVFRLYAMYLRLLLFCFILFKGWIPTHFSMFTWCLKCDTRFIVFATGDRSHLRLQCRRPVSILKRRPRMITEYTVDSF